MRRTCRRNSVTLIVFPGSLAFLTIGCLLYASSAGPVAAHTKSGPRIPASQKPRRRWRTLERISSSTLLSHPGRAKGLRFLQTSHTDDASADDDCALILLASSFWIGQLPSTTKPERIIAATRASQALGSL